MTQVTRSLCLDCLEDFLFDFLTNTTQDLFHSKFRAKTNEDLKRSTVFVLCLNEVNHLRMVSVAKPTLPL